MFSKKFWAGAGVAVSANVAANTANFASLNDFNVRIPHHFKMVINDAAAEYGLPHVAQRKNTDRRPSGQPAICQLNVRRNDCRPNRFPGLGGARRGRKGRAPPVVSLLTDSDKIVNYWFAAAPGRIGEPTGGGR